MVVRVATDGFLADHVPQGLQRRIHALFSAAGTAGSLLGATVSGVLYAVEPGVPLLAMALLVESVHWTYLRCSQCRAWQSGAFRPMRSRDRRQPWRQNA